MADKESARKNSKHGETTLDNKDIFKPSKKYPGFRRNFLDYFQEYTDYTGIHGFKYMGEKDRSIFEKYVEQIKHYKLNMNNKRKSYIFLSLL